MGCGSSTVAAEPTIAVVPGASATPAGSSGRSNSDGNEGAASSPPSSGATPLPNSNANQNNNSNRPLREQYSPAHATSLPAPRLSISAASGVARAETVSGGKVESKQKSSGNMPAVRELLSNVPIKNALLPNFYRSAAFNTSANPSLEPSSLDHHSSPPDGWSDSDEELDEEEHKETLQMLNELTMLSVPSPGLRQHYSSSEGNPLSQVPHDSKLVAATPTPYGDQLSWEAIAQSNLVASAKASQSGTPGSNSALASHHSVTSSIVTSSGSVAMVPHRKASQGQPETLFHGFYAKRCIHTVKKSMLSSGMFLTFKDMFESLDPQNSGYISKNSWTNLLTKLGLALDSAASLSRIAGLNDSPTITLEQFATVMALSLHGPYLRMLQSSQNSVRREVFLGGEKAAWRQDIVLPFFTKMKIPFFSAPAKKKALVAGESDSSANGSDGEWNAEGVILEAVAKSQCQMMLYVVDKDTRSIASMVEASEHITSLKEVLLVMEDVKAGSTIGGETLSAPEAKDLNRGRAYLADVAHRNAHGGVTVFKHMTDACDYVVKRFDGSIVRPSLKVFRKPVLAIPASTSNGPTPAQTPALKPSNPTHMHALSTSKNNKSAGLQVTVPPMPGGSPEASETPLPPPSTASTFSMTNSPLAALMSGQARRHSTGLPQRVSSPTMSNGALPPAPKGSALAVPGAHHTSHSISFNPEEWPANPQPTDFDRYISSAHFSECSRIVFKHQVLLCKRAAAKAQLNSAVLNSVAQIGSPSTSAPPGLFRMTSSPIVTNIRRSPHPASVETGNPESAEIDAVPDLVPQHSRVPSSSDRFRQSESFSSAGTSRVVLSVNQSDEESQLNGNGSGNGSLRSQGSFSTNPLQRSPSQMEGAASSPVPGTSELKEKDKDSPESVKRPLSSSQSQSKLLDPLQAAGLNVNIIPPEPLAQPPLAADANAALSVEDVIPTAHLFTMLIRLHEIIQLATGIHFLHPYPSLVSATAEGKLSDVLRIGEWMQLSKQVFSQLRGIHEAAAPPSGSPSASPDAMDSPMIHQSHLSSGGLPTDSPTLTVDGLPRRRSLNRSNGGTGSPLIGSSGISPHQFIRQLSTVGQNPPKRSADPLILEPGIGSNNPTASPNPSGSTSYTQSSRAKTASMDAGASLVEREKLGLGSGGKIAAVVAEKPVASPAPSVVSSPVVNYSQVAQRVKARITAQKKVVESLQAHKLTSSGSNASSNSNSAGSSQSPSVSVNASMAGVAAAAVSNALTPSKVEEMGSLSASDLTKLAASVSASLAHDQLLLKEMMPSFTAMYKAIDASEAGSVSMDQVSSFLSDKLLLPTASVTCLMDVLNVALANCLFEATSVTSATANTALTANASTTGTDATVFTADSFDRSRLAHPAFSQVLSKALHLQSNAFSSFLASDAVNFVQKSKRVCSQVFLGGSCNPTTWRKDEAIPILEDASVSYYNPQLDNWSNELVLIESLVKQNSEILLFVIDSETRAIASMIEASEYICSGRDVVLVVKNMDQAGKVNNEALGAQQVMDLNRARSYVTDVAQRHGLDVFTDITLACEYIVTKLREKEAKEAAYLAEVESFISSEEFVEKTYEEFFRCDLQQTSKISGTQLLLACLHLEQDLRPLLPPQSVKHRQPSVSDIEFVGKMFGTFNTNDQQYELTAEQFLEFSRMLFRNVCAHVKL